MGVKRNLPIGNDDFRKLRENDSYYVDKTLMIRDFIKMQDVVALIARPRRFGKTLNMTMLREFFDISRDSRDLFKGLAIMDTEYADQINYGVQRVAKESIFSQFNNPQVYTVIDREYAPYFGLNESETRTLLEAYGYELSEDVRRMYDGYQIGGTGIYNPWSVICYAKKGRLESYWVKTSANFLVKSALKSADRNFWNTFDKLAAGGEEWVYATLDTSFAERDSLYSLWGLLVNAGYLTVVKWIDADSYIVKIPNHEVLSELQLLITELSGVDRLDLQQIFQYLMNKDMNGFLSISCTSYMDAKENACHMLFLGMCITLHDAYKVTSNLEAGYGRSGITLQALFPKNINVILEFKQGKDKKQLKEEALQQILQQKYYAGLSGEVLCAGVAHDKKRCEIAHKRFFLNFG